MRSEKPAELTDREFGLLGDHPVPTQPDLFGPSQPGNGRDTSGNAHHPFDEIRAQHTPAPRTGHGRGRRRTPEDVFP